jgi:hypothetical protein
MIRRAIIAVVRFRYIRANAERHNQTTTSMLDLNPKVIGDILLQKTKISEDINWRGHVIHPIINGRLLLSRSRWRYH